MAPRKTRHTAHLDGFPAAVRVVRARHPLAGDSLELIGWMRRRGALELILVLPDGSRALIPAAWTDLEPSPQPPGAGTLGSLEDLLAARRLVEGLLARLDGEAMIGPSRADVECPAGCAGLP